MISDMLWKPQQQLRQLMMQEQWLKQRWKSTPRTWFMKMNLKENMKILMRMHLSMKLRKDVRSL